MTVTKITLIFSILFSPCLCVSYPINLTVPLINTTDYLNSYLIKYNMSLSNISQTVFETNLLTVLEHNLNYRFGKTTYTKDLNHFASTDVLEKSKHLKISKLPLNMNGNKGVYREYKPIRLDNRVNLVYYDNYDWRDYGFRTMVRDQGDCGSCWAITVVGALESRAAWYRGETIELSPQELVDCSLKDYGCEGGWFDSAFQYIAEKQNKWLAPERSYPYTGRRQQCRLSSPLGEDDGQCLHGCHYKSSDNKMEHHTPPLKCVGSERIPENEEVLKEALVYHGPVAIALHVTQNLYLYSKGIFADDSCNSNSLNHAVLLVGYGRDLRTGLDYWIIKNSWGTDWGEDGYFRIQRGVNMCGVAAYAVKPIIDY